MSLVRALISLTRFNCQHVEHLVTKMILNVWTLTSSRAAGHRGLHKRSTAWTLVYVWPGVHVRLLVLDLSSASSTIFLHTPVKSCSLNWHHSFGNGPQTFWPSDHKLLKSTPSHLHLSAEWTGFPPTLRMDYLPPSTWVKGSGTSKPVSVLGLRT